jgi:hypothetical protein
MKFYVAELVNENLKVIDTRYFKAENFDSAFEQLRQEVSVNLWPPVSDRHENYDLYEIEYEDKSTMKEAKIYFKRYG